MQTSNGQGVEQNHSVNTQGTRKVSKTKVLLTSAQAEFMDLVLSHGTSELVRSLKMIHDLALYHSDVPFDDLEKVALFDIKLLWEGLEEISREA